MFPGSPEFFPDDVRTFQSDSRGHLVPVGPDSQDPGLTRQCFESIHQVFREIESASDSEMQVLIMGGMGSGRELAARAIHNLSGSRFLPFASLTCGLASEILTSELIGHQAASLS